MYSIVKISRADGRAFLDLRGLNFIQAMDLVGLTQFYVYIAMPTDLALQFTSRGGEKMLDSVELL